MYQDLLFADIDWKDMKRVFHVFFHMKYDNFYLRSVSHGIS